MQQIMKTIKLQEQADKQKKETKISKLAIKAQQEIEEELPLKIKGKPGRKSRRSFTKESKEPLAKEPEPLAKEPEPLAVLPPTPPRKSPGKIGIALKKDAVFFK